MCCVPSRFSACVPFFSFLVCCSTRSSIAAAAAALQTAKVFTDKKTSTQAFVGSVPREQPGGQPSIVVAFRGTQDLRNWISNLNFPKHHEYSKCSGCRVHEGFYEAWQSVAAPLLAEVTRLHALAPDSSIFIAGHSLGAALAVLAAAEIGAQDKSLGLNVTGVYTYGEHVLLLPQPLCWPQLADTAGRRLHACKRADEMPSSVSARCCRFLSSEFHADMWAILMNLHHCNRQHASSIGSASNVHADTCSIYIYTLMTSPPFFFLFCTQAESGERSFPTVLQYRSQSKLAADPLEGPGSAPPIGIHGVPAYIPGDLLHSRQQELYSLRWNWGGRQMLGWHA